MVSCLACGHKFGGSIPCQASATSLIRSNIVLSGYNCGKNSKSEAEFIIGTLSKLTRRPRGGSHIHISIQLRVSDVKGRLKSLGLESF